LLNPNLTSDIERFDSNFKPSVDILDAFEISALNSKQAGNSNVICF
jgi:hypothetical protein